MTRFDNVIIGQKAFIINQQKQILIMKRQKTDLFTGFWDVPGGKLEQEDTLFSGLAREIQEETGLELQNIILCLSSSRFTGGVSDRPTVLRNTYLCRATGTVRLSPENSEFKWVTASDLVNYQFPSNPDLQYVHAQLPTILAHLDLSIQYSNLI